MLPGACILKKESGEKEQLWASRQFLKLLTDGAVMLKGLRAGSELRRILADDDDNKNSKQIHFKKVFLKM